MIPAFVVSNLSELFHFKSAEPPFVNVAYVAPPIAFLKLIVSLRISDTVIALEKVVTPMTLTLSKLHGHLHLNL